MRGSADELEQKLRERGAETAPAVITGTKSGKVVTSDDPAQAGIAQVLWKLTLRVTPENGAPFNAVIRVPYPQKSGGPPVGSMVGVLYDPRDRAKIVIDRSAPTESFAAQNAAAMARVLPPGTGTPRGPLVIVGGQVVSPSVAAEAPSVADQLTQLADLKDRGVITESEFRAQKQKLLET